MEEKNYLDLLLSLLGSQPKYTLLFRNLTHAKYMSLSIRNNNKNTIKQNITSNN